MKNTSTVGPAVSQSRVMVDLCLCGHGRQVHLYGFQGCLVCTKKGPAGKFSCKPGSCDRFTWNPDAETR